MKVNDVELKDDNDMVIRASEKGIFERETFKYFQDNVKEDSTFLDVGAYTGIYSIFANVTKCCKVYAFEPNKIVFERLIENVTKNRCCPNDIIVFNHGLSNATRTTRLYVNPRTKLTSGGSLTQDIGKTKNINCQLHKFDEMTISILNIDIIKIDVEGHELEVLQGMSKMLKRDKPKIIIELLSEKDILKSDKFLKELGYKFKMRCDDRNYIYE